MSKCIGAVTGVKRYVFNFFIKYLCILLGLYWFNNIVKHLNINNMNFTRLLVISHFMHVQGMEGTTK
jgi:hypothetical protein